MVRLLSLQVDLVVVYHNYRNLQIKNLEKLANVEQIGRFDCDINLKGSEHADS